MEGGRVWEGGCGREGGTQGGREGKEGGRERGKEGRLGQA